MTRYGTYTPKKTREYEARIREAAARVFRLTDKPVAMEIWAFFPVPKSYSKRRVAELKAAGWLYLGKPDADNLAKIAMDACNRIAYADDKQVVVLTVVKTYARPGEEVCMTIEINELEEKIYADEEP